MVCCLLLVCLVYEVAVSWWFWCFGLYWFGCDFSVVWYCIVMFACVIADLGLIVICVVVLFGFGILLVLLVYLGGVWCFLLGCRVWVRGWVFWVLW